MLIVPRAILGRDGTGNAWLTTITPEGERPWTPGAFHPPVPPGDLRWHDGSLSAPEWEQVVGEAVRRIKHSADLRKVVLARDLHASADIPIDPRVLLRWLAARYPGCFTFACDGLLGATPELLIRKDGWEVSSLVLAGTTPRGATQAEDSALASALLGSAKENEEHQYAAASLRDTLSPLCAAMYVTPRPELIRLPNVQHLGSLGARHPGGRQVRARARRRGAPDGRRRRHADGRRRRGDPRAGVAWTGNGTPARSAGSTRTATASGASPCGARSSSGNRARLFAGGGIVAGSDPAAELAETESKLRPMRSALEQAD